MYYNKQQATHLYFHLEFLLLKTPSHSCYNCFRIIILFFLRESIKKPLPLQLFRIKKPKLNWRRLSGILYRDHIPIYYPDNIVIIWFICFGFSVLHELSHLWFIQQSIMKQRWLSENCEHRLFWGIATNFLNSFLAWKYPSLAYLPRWCKTFY